MTDEAHLSTETMDAPIEGLDLDRRTRRITLSGIDVELTPKEFDLLSVLAEDSVAVLSHHGVMAAVKDPHLYRPTTTVRGIGFRVRP